MALCLSGLTRGFNGSDTLKENIINTCNPDIFCTTYDIVGKQIDNFRRINEMDKAIDLDSTLDKLYTPKLKVIYSWANIKPLLVEQFSQYTDAEHAQIIHTISQYLQWFFCGQLKLLYEQISLNKRYDIVIRARYDAFYEHKITIDELVETKDSLNVIHTPY